MVARGRGDGNRIENYPAQYTLLFCMSFNIYQSESENNALTIFLTLIVLKQCCQPVDKNVFKGIHALDKDCSWQYH